TRFVQTPLPRKLPKPSLIDDPSLKHFSISPFPLNHFPSYPPKTRWPTCYRRTSGRPMATQIQTQANRRRAQLSTRPRPDPVKATPPSETDPPETQTPEIGSVPHTTPTPAGPAAAVDQHASRHD